LIGTGLDVLLLESGGTRFERSTQQLYSGEVDDPVHHGPLTQFRRRMFGGTTTVWGGRCSPFDGIDFEKREGVPNSGWPVTREELDPFYGRAHAYTDTGRYCYEVPVALPGAPTELIPGLASDVVLQDRLWRFSLPTNFARANKARLERAPNVKVLLHANVLKILTNSTGNAATGLHVSSLRRNQFEVRARRYVLASGGLEVARLLLLSNDAHPRGLGNEHDLVGRFYISHISGDLGEIQFTPATRAVVWDYERDPDGVYCKRHLRISERVQRRSGLLNFRCHLSHPPFEDPTHGNAILSAAYLAKRVLRKKVSPEYSREMAGRQYEHLGAHVRNTVVGAPHLAAFGLRWTFVRTLRSRKYPSVSLRSRSNRYALHFDAEQAPNYDSRVMLDDEVDDFGLRRLRVQWRCSKLDIESVVRSYELITQELERSEVGRADLRTSDIRDAVRGEVGVGSHHIGTTRMSANPSMGVVDKECRMHTVDNLYVAGPSVFCTSSFANPVLTTTALAVRLADHLKIAR
jgi:choline dehydrogenase-like flavoprotein